MAPLKNLLPLHKKDAENSTAAPSIPTTASIEPKEGHEHAAQNGHDYRPQSDHSHNPRSEHSRRHHYRDNARARKNALSKWMSNKWRNELVATVAEFCGTYMFLFFAFGGTQVANTAALYADASVAGQDNNSLTQAPNTSVLLYISLIFGFSLMVTVWVFFRVSGGLFNPAVTLGLLLIHAISPLRAGLCFVAQMLAGICAAAVVEAILPGPLNVSTTLGQGVSPTQGVFLEMFLTSMLVFTIFMLAAEKHKATFLAPVGIGLSLFISEMVGVFFTGGSLNPARSFGPCVVTREFPGYHYIYWFGPIMGALLAFGMYRIVKISEYQTVNPGQDFDDHEAALFKPPEDAETAAQVERPNVAAIAAEEAVRMATRESMSERGSMAFERRSTGLENRNSFRSSVRIERRSVTPDGRGSVRNSMRLVSGSVTPEMREEPRYISERELLERTGHARS